MIGSVNHFEQPALWIEQAIENLAEHADDLRDAREFNSKQLYFRTKLPKRELEELTLRLERVRVSG